MPDNRPKPKPGPFKGAQRPQQPNRPAPSRDSSTSSVEKERRGETTDSHRTPIAGPLGQLITADNDAIQNLDGANALIMMRRVALLDGEKPVQAEDVHLLHDWAKEAQLGMKMNRTLIENIRARRDEAIKNSGLEFVHASVSPYWRMITGIGERANPHEIGICLHGTYGWPMIPGSTIKGVTAAWAREIRAEPKPTAYRRIFGHPIDRSPADNDPQGSVIFMDALPQEPLEITVDIVNPHFRNEWTNPVPSHFLTVSKGSFDIYLLGKSKDDCSQALDWLHEAVNTLGIGAKTGVGYGYLKTEEQS